MRVAVAGASGFIGSRLVPRLRERGHDVVAIDSREPGYEAVENRKLDLRDKEKLRSALEDVEAVYYLAHSMVGRRSFRKEEAETAEVFRRVCEDSSVQQVIFFTGIVNTGAGSEHLLSRRDVGRKLESGDYAYTELRAGMVLGRGSASYELMKDVVERLPVILLPRWLDSESQPIYVGDAMEYLLAVLGEEKAYGEKFDIGGPERLSYFEVMRQYAEFRGLKRYFVPVPLLTTRFASYWFRLLTSQDHALASGLVRSLEYDLVVEKPVPEDIIEHNPLSFREALQEVEKESNRDPKPVREDVKKKKSYHA